MATENDNWPSFSMPASDGTSEPAPATPPAASEPGGSALPAAADSAQPAPPGPSAPPPVDPSTGEMLPKYRYDELHARYEATNKQVEQLTGLLTRALALQQQPPPQPGEPPDPRHERIRSELDEAWPGLKAAIDFYLAKKDELERTIQQTQQLGGYVESLSAREKAEWDLYAKRSVESVIDAVSPHLLGKGKAGKDLDPDRKQAIVDQYIAWIGKQPDRMARYNSQDSTLRDEFVKSFVQQWVDPVRRGSSADLARGARAVQNLPVAGGPGPVLGTPAAKPNNDDEDAVYKRAWAVAQAQMNS